MSDEANNNDSSISAATALVRYLTKTVIRAGIWVLLAYATLYFFPAATWVWYVVAGFVLISLLWALFLAYLAMVDGRQP